MQQRDPTLAGTVQDVHGATVSVALDEATVAGLSFIEGHGYRVGQVGSFVRIPIGYVDLFGVVSQVGAGAVPERLAQLQPFGYRWMTVQLVGEAERGGLFRRGLSQSPTIGDSAHLVTNQDLSRIYGRPNQTNFVRIGQLASADSIPALIDVNKLVSRHSAIVGVTGAGKSTTVAGLLSSLSAPGTYPSARILLFDLHGEYAKALRDRARIFRVGADGTRGERPFCVPYWAMTFDELLSVTFGQLDDASRGAVLEKIVSLKAASLSGEPRRGVTPETLTVDTPVPFSLHALWLDLHRLVNGTYTIAAPSAQGPSTEALAMDAQGEPIQRGDALKVIPPKFKPHTQSGSEKIFLSAAPLNIRRQLEALASRLRDPRFDFLFKPGEWFPDIDGHPRKDLDTLVEEWIGGPEPVAILDLSGVPVSLTTELIGTLLRVIYDAMLWARNLAEGARERPLLVVLEEAHSYVGQGDSGPAARAVRRIVKEGRKYGIGAMIVSQRPAEIDSTILSQCGTIVAMRMSNKTDRGHVSSAMSDNLEGLLDMLPILRTGEAIVVGEAVTMPMRVIIDVAPPHRRPDSNDPLVCDESGPGGWDRPRSPDRYSEVLEVWRGQNPRSPSIVDKPVPSEHQGDEIK